MPKYLMPLDNFRKKLLYRSLHRGCKETDLLLGQFAIKHIPNMSQEGLLEWDQILNQSDSDIVSWIMKLADAPTHLQSEVMRKLIAS